MKNQKGITLITLAITIMVMSLIAGVVTYSGMESVNNAKKTAFISELEMVQAKVNTIYEKRKTSTNETNYYNQLGIDATLLEDDEITTALGGTPKDGFRYFYASDLKAIGLDNINQQVLINYDTREVVSVTGIKIDGVMYYKLKDIPNYSGYNVEYENTNTQAPTFTVEVTKSSSSYQVTLKNIVYNGNVEGGTVSYKLHSNTNWILNGNNNSFTVTTTGLYDIKLTDKAGNSTTVQQNIG